VAPASPQPRGECPPSKRARKPPGNAPKRGPQSAAKATDTKAPFVGPTAPKEGRGKPDDPPPEEQAAAQESRRSPNEDELVSEWDEDFTSAFFEDERPGFDDDDDGSLPALPVMNFRAVVDAFSPAFKWLMGIGASVLGIGAAIRRGGVGDFLRTLTRRWRRSLRAVNFWKCNACTTLTILHVCLLFCFFVANGHMWHIPARL
jgi:hypothetical protein